MLRYVIFLLLVSACLCQEDVARRNKTKYKHKHHLYHSGILYYLAFLAIKVKVVFLIGAAISFALFSGKLFALLKYGAYSQDHHKEPEKIYIQSPAAPSYHSHDFSPPEFYEHDRHSKNSQYIRDSPPEFYEPDRHGKDPRPEFYENKGSHYARDLKSGFLEPLMKSMQEYMKRVNFTEIAFDSMEIKEENCRRRFMCEAKYSARNNLLVAFGMFMFGDDKSKKYRTNEAVNSYEDCAKIYTDCIN